MGSKCWMPRNVNISKYASAEFCDISRVFEIIKLLVAQTIEDFPN